MGWFMDLLQGVPLNAVLKERVALAEQKFNDLEERNKQLQEQVVALTAENASLKNKLEQAPVAAVPPKETPEVFGGLYYFGGDHTHPFCPKCYEREGKKHHMARTGSLGSRCTVCGNVVYR
jgi:hypothetical protein